METKLTDTDRALWRETFKTPTGMYAKPAMESARETAKTESGVLRLYRVDGFALTFTAADCGAIYTAGLNLDDSPAWQVIEERQREQWGPTEAAGRIRRGPWPAARPWGVNMPTDLDYTPAGDEEPPKQRRRGRRG